MAHLIVLMLLILSIYVLKDELEVGAASLVNVLLQADWSGDMVLIVTARSESDD